MKRRTFRKKKKRKLETLIYIYFFIFLMGAFVVTFLLLKNQKDKKKVSIKKKTSIEITKVKKPVVYEILSSKELEIAVEDFLFLNNIKYLKENKENKTVFKTDKVYDYSLIKKKFYSFIKRKGANFIEATDKDQRFLWKVLKGKKERIVIYGEIGEIKPSLRKAKIAVLIDDMGYETEKFKKFLKAVNYKIGVSIIPNSSQRDTARKIAMKNGAEIWLHVPMEPVKKNGNKMNLDGFLLVRMREDYIEALTDEYFSLVPEAVGANNHTGSLFTQIKDKLIPFFKVLKKRKKFFIDSRTTSKTVAYLLAQKMGIPSFKRDIFIDGESEAAVLNNLIHLIKISERNGKALGIGHPEDATFKALLKLKKMCGNRIKIVFPSELIRQK